MFSVYLLGNVDKHPLLADFILLQSPAKMRPLFVAVIFSLVAVNISNAITCSGNGDCNANMECKKKSTGCNKGNCVCKPGYSGSDCKRST